MSQQQQELSEYAFTDAEIADFQRDGFVLRRGLFTKKEVEGLNQVVKSDAGIADAVYGRVDRSGATTELALWNHLSDDMFGAVARSRRIVDNLERVLGGEIAFYHSKLTLKRPKVGGSWEWHQDYGYWYRNGFLFPDMASVFIALDPSRKENGCLQVLRGSHLIGRIEHGAVAGQIGADMAYVEAAMKRCSLVYVEMEPGDALFFHANLLHASGPNMSENSRNVLLCCYNRADNVSFKEQSNSGQQRIEKLADDAVIDYMTKPLDATRSFARPTVPA